MVPVLQETSDVVAALCRKYNVVRLYVFGSALRDDLRPGESHVDLLVEFAPMDGYDRATAKSRGLSTGHHRRLRHNRPCSRTS